MAAAKVLKNRLGVRPDTVPPIVHIAGVPVLAGSCFPFPILESDLMVGFSSFQMEMSLCELCNLGNPSLLPSRVGRWNALFITGRDVTGAAPSVFA